MKLKAPYIFERDMVLWGSASTAVQHPPTCSLGCRDSEKGVCRLSCSWTPEST